MKTFMKWVAIAIGLIIMTVITVWLSLMWSVNHADALPTYLGDSDSLVRAFRDSALHDKYYKEDMEKAMVKGFGVSWAEAKYWTPVFKDIADQKKVPWMIFPAMMEQESRFNPTAKSKKGAYNMVQGMHGTMEMMANDLNLPWKGWGHFKSHDLHMMISGCNYLADGIEKDVTIENGLRFYFAGPNWRKKTKVMNSIHTYSAEVIQRYEKIRYVFMGVQAERKK